eukprot:TRINITY_DN7116_c0_g1_i1.p1 TRINITY_DN7116_c0_g1~~TRINITY_DN7116_c0_g1_i1.p1  ORF type:complete len:438 (+),score=101.09 TRINITY_DN7116_c0_g1_i1:75-1388(+)
MYSERRQWEFGDDGRTLEGDQGYGRERGSRSGGRMPPTPSNISTSHRRTPIQGREYGYTESDEGTDRFASTKPLSKHLDPNLDEPQWPQKMMDQALQFRRELTDAQIEVKALKKENSRLVQLLAKEIEKEERMMRDLDNAEARMERLKMEQENKNKSWLERMETYQEMQNKLMETESVNAQLKGEVQVLEDRIKVLEADNQDLRTTLISVRGGMDIKAEQLAGEKEKIKELEAMLHDLRNEYRTKEVTWKHMEEEFARTMQAIQIQLNTHLASLNEERKNNMSLRAELQMMARFKEENLVISRHKQDAEKARDQLDSELSTMRFQFEKLKMESLMAHSEKAKEFQMLVHAVEDLRKKLETTEERLAQREWEKSESTRLCESLKNELDALKKEKAQDQSQRQETKTARKAILDAWERELKDRTQKQAYPSQSKDTPAE